MAPASRAAGALMTDAISFSSFYREILLVWEGRRAGRRAGWMGCVTATKPRLSFPTKETPSTHPRYGTLLPEGPRAGRRTGQAGEGEVQKPSLSPLSSRVAGGPPGVCRHRAAPARRKSRDPRGDRRAQPRVARARRARRAARDRGCRGREPPERMAGTNETLNALPPGIRERLLVEFLNDLYRHRGA